MKAQLKALEEKYLQTVYDWRMQDSVRLQMLNSGKFSYEQHCSWYEQIKQSKIDQYYVFEVDEIPYGVICMNQMDWKKGLGEWGFYMGTPERPRKSSVAMAYLFFKHYFECGGFQEIHAKVLRTNTRSIAYHERLGFVSTSQVDECILYLLTYENWLRKKEPLKYRLIQSGYQLED